MNIHHLKKILVEFIDELLLQSPDNEKLICYRIYINDQLPIDNLLDECHSLFTKHIEDIKDRNEYFFIISKLQLYDIWFDDTVLDDDDRKNLWEWINMILKCIQKVDDKNNNKHGEENNSVVAIDKNDVS